MLNMYQIILSVCVWEKWWNVYKEKWWNEPIFPLASWGNNTSVLTQVPFKVLPFLISTLFRMPSPQPLACYHSYPQFTCFFTGLWDHTWSTLRLHWFCHPTFCPWKLTMMILGPWWYLSWFQFYEKFIHTVGTDHKHFFCVNLFFIFLG